MKLELTFKDICSALKAEGKDDLQLIAAVDHLIGLAMVCSPVILGPYAAAMIPMLAVKNEVVKTGKVIVEKLQSRKDDDYVKRQETMQIAYGLLVFTAFFDALDSCIPKALRREIALLDPEKVFLAKDSVRKITDNGDDGDDCPRVDAPVSNVAMAFAHPTESLSEQADRYRKLWKQMSQGFAEFVRKLAFWENSDEKVRTQILLAIEKVEEEAAKRFEAQYFELARRFPDFAVWANLLDRKNSGARLGELSDYVKQHARLAAANETSIDVGFRSLHKAVQSIPEVLRIGQAEELVESLSKHYQARIHDPIIEDREDVDEDKPRLSFPRISEGFIPQAYKVLRHGVQSRRLEDESTWSDVPRRNDLGAFLLSYLSSPYSTEAPLLVLGHPGSGKSLLTKMLAAQLMSRHFTVIRVPLREVNADADVVTQIEDAIRRITGVSGDSWIKLSGQFRNCPPLLILDGYDELLQASGQVFASYIKDAQRFQERESEQGRPVRVIITSRVTLFDKAMVPPGATIIRLLEFDEAQRDRWIGIWNSANANYFRDSKTRPFSLPESSEEGADKILNLAEQPLLLLMLAIYDSQDNQLRKNRELDRTRLYDSLLRRFILRERQKERLFHEMEPAERDGALSTEMRRLGVAALGMYNRRKVHILASELDDDLRFFKLERAVPTRTGKALGQAELLLGSFFFVHKSRARHHIGSEETHEETSAFEFLHNTFGEFLTADFVLRSAIAQVQTFRASQTIPELRSTYEKLMTTPDGFERDWFASLVYAPVFSRPVIMEMIREWTPQVLKQNGLTEVDFVGSLEALVLNQIDRLLNKREMPSIIRKETALDSHRVPVGEHPLVGHIAIYSMNLILLRISVGSEPFIFHEDRIASHEDGARPWDRLIHIWRSWFALNNLNGLTAVMLAKRSEATITIEAKKKFQASEGKSRLQRCFNISQSLADGVSTGLAGLVLFDPCLDSAADLDEIALCLNSEGFDLELTLAIKRLYVLATRLPESADQFLGLGRQAIDMALRTEGGAELGQICLLIARSFDRVAWASVQPLRSRSRHSIEVFRSLMDIHTAVEVAMRDPSSARILWAIARDIDDYEWQSEFSGRFLERTVYEAPLGEAFSIGASGMPVSLQIFREIAGERGLRSEYGGRGLELRIADRLFHPRILLGLAERSPQGVLVYLQMLRLIGGERFLGRYESQMQAEIWERLVNRDLLQALNARNPEDALAYIQVLRDLGGVRFLERLVREVEPEFVIRLFHPTLLLDMAERNPQGVLAYVQLTRDICGGRNADMYWYNIGPELLERLLHPRLIRDLIERNPAEALAYMEALRELNGEGSHVRYKREANPEHFARLFHPGLLLDLTERNPDCAMIYIQLLRDLGDGHAIGLFSPDLESGLLELMSRPGRLSGTFHHTPSAVSAWLALARLAQSHLVCERLARFIVEWIEQSGRAGRIIAALPLSALPDIRWLAEESGNSELMSALAELLSLVHDAS